MPAKGLEQLLQTISKVKKQINPNIKIEGILITMVDNQTNFAKDISILLRETYGNTIKLFETDIPHSVRAAERGMNGEDRRMKKDTKRYIASKAIYSILFCIVYTIKCDKMR